MNACSEAPAGTPGPAEEAGYRWLPTLALLPGMVIARPVQGYSGPLMTMYLAAGSVISGNTVAQLIVKGVECVAVRDDTPPDAAADAQACAGFQQRLDAIFGAQPSAACSALRAALIRARRVL